MYKRQEVYLTNEFDGEKAEAGDFSVLLENKTGAVTFGEPYANGSGYNCYPALVCANGSSLSYYTAVMPSEACIAAHNAMAYVKQDIAVSAEPGVFSLGVELAVGCFTINAPQGAEVAVCENLSDGVVKQHSWDAVSYTHLDVYKRQVLYCQRGGGQRREYLHKK